MSEAQPQTHPIFDFGGSGPVMHLSVATGFPPQTYLPLLEPLTSRYRVVSVLPRALWPHPPDPESFSTWQQLGDDIIGGLRERDLGDVVALGHSMGGVASMLAVLAEPGRFRALILLDPTFLPPHIANMIYFLQIIGQGRRFPVVQGALRRRGEYATLDEAFENWRSRPLFKNWPERTIRLYAESMTRPSGNAAGVELVWSPRWEARYYQTIYLNWAHDVKKLRGLLPVLAVQGAQTDTFTNTSVGIMRRLLPGATYRRIEGHGHLFPQSAPDQTRTIIEEWLAALPTKLKG